MSKIPDPEDLLIRWAENYMDFPSSDAGNEAVSREMRKFCIKIRDITLEWAAENASLETVDYGIGTYEQVDKNSILSGKTSKDLEI